MLHFVLEHSRLTVYSVCTFLIWYKTITATKLGQGNIFRSVCPHSVHGGGGACVVALGGHAWLPGGVCVVAQGGHA